MRKKAKKRRGERRDVYLSIVAAKLVIEDLERAYNEERGN